MSAVQKVCCSRLGSFPQETVDDWKLRGLVAALVVNDLGAARLLLSECGGASFDRRVCTPFGGHRVYPIEAVVEGAALEDEKCDMARQLQQQGATMNVTWADTAGEHTPLSKALSLQQLRLAATLVELGASPSTALLETNLLEACRFDPAIVRWLLDAGADVTVPAHHPLRPCLVSGGSISATVTLLGKAGLELHVMRQLSSLHAIPSSEQQHQRELLERLAQDLTLLLAAGAPPFHAPPPPLQQHHVGPGPTPPLPQDPTFEPPSTTSGRHESSGRLSGGHAVAQEAAPFSLAQHAAPGAVGTAAVQHWGPAGSVALPQHQGQQQMQQQQQGRQPQQWPEALPALQELHLGSLPTPSAMPGFPRPPLGLTQADWDFLQAYATQVPQWSPQLHALFPRPLRLAIREMVMISRCRGFGGGSQVPASPVPASALPAGAACTPGSAGCAPPCAPLPVSPRTAAGGSPRGNADMLPPLAEHESPRAVQPPGGKQGPRQGQQEGVVWLDAGVLECIFQHLASVWNQHD